MVFDGPPYAPSNGGHVVGANPGGSNAHLLAAELDEEEQELWRQLRRKRDFESRVVDKRAQLQELRDRRRKVSGHHAEVHASCDHLKQELEFAEEQEREVKHDIDVLVDANEEAMQREDRRARQNMSLLQPNYFGRDPKAILAEEQQRQEEIQLQHDKIKHLRTHLEKLREEKERMQHKQRILFEKQRSAEQDRNRLLHTLQDDRKAINDVRQDRIRLYKERSEMEREIARIVHEAQVGANEGAATYADGTLITDATGGLHTSVKETDGGLHAGTVYGLGPARPMQQLSPSAIAQSQRDGYPSGGLGAPSFADPLSRGGSPEFNRRASGETGTGVGISEWSDKLHSYRGGGGAY